MNRTLPSLAALLLLGLHLYAEPLPFRATPQDRLIVSVSDPALLEPLLSGGAELIHDYGAFQWVETQSQALQRLHSSGIEAHTDATTIYLHAGSLNTATETFRSSAPSPGKGNHLHLVQFAAPITPEWHRSLLETGVRIIDYIPNHAYLVYGDAEAVQAIRAVRSKLPAMRFDGPFLPADKIHPLALDPSLSSADTVNGRTFQIQLVSDKLANQQTLELLDLLKLSPIRRISGKDPYLNIVAELPHHAIDLIAAQPDVLSIWPYITPRKRDERQAMIVAGQLAGNLPAGPGYLAWLTGRGFTQSQFDASDLVVDVTDSGLDNGTTNINHFALFRNGTTASTSRVRYVRREGSANPGSSIQGCDGHGNINAHIIGGYVTLTNFPHTDSSGYRYGLGIAPFVKVGSSVIFDPDNFTFPDYDNLASRAYRDGARISGNSWGADTFGGYDADAQNYDRLVRDAQPSGAAVSTPGNQQMTFVFAAGNSGPTSGSVGSPGTAKNVITVGAAENVHSHAITNGGNRANGNDGCSTPDSEANSANDIASFSSRGPTSDQRRKPEIVAPGTHITGGMAQNVRTMAGLGTSLSCFDATGVCALPGGGTTGSTNNFFPLGQRWYSTSSGTSHSTPAVAGGAALIYQWFLNQFGQPPSPAMTKAFLVNSGRYMNGTGANDSLFSNQQGMGMMNLATAFDGAPRFLRDQLTNDLFTASGQIRTFTGIIPSNNLPLRITLVWTDAPGSTAGNAYRNNLDLAVTVNGQLYRGNVFTGATSAPGGSFDIRNNTESVFLPPGTTGTVAITVTAANINSDGIPNFGSSLDQDFALIAYNFTEQLAPSIVSAASTLTAESCGSGNNAIDPEETVSVAFALRNIGTANTTNVVATLLPAGGVTLPSPPQLYGALAAGGPTVTQTFSFTASGSCGDLLTATLSLDDGGNPLGNIAFTFPLGQTAGFTSTFTNPSVITIRDNNTATPYPSSLLVSGMQGELTKAVVTLQGFTHTYPSDVDILLVSPNGQRVALMGSVGGSASINNATLTFDDDAPGPVGSPLVTGVYQPSGSIASMPAPAPAGPYSSSLSHLNGTSPNGTWSLYVRDAAAADSGTIAAGWRLTLTAGEPLCCGSNKPPVLAPIGNQSIVTSNSLIFSVTATDPNDGDPISLVASNLPPGATFAATNGNGTFTWLQASPTGTYSVTFHASDKDGFHAETILILVTDTPEFNPDCALILSEYLEGSSNNKAIELFNPGPDPIDLTTGNYLLHIYFNGSTTPGSTINLTGSIPAQGTFVIANSSANSAILAAAQQTNGTLTFNGNDPVVLRVGGPSGQVVDSIGQVGNNANFAIDTTLRRKPSVLFGDSVINDTFSASLEWDSFPTDTSSGLGAHENECQGGSPSPGSPPVVSPLGDFTTLLGNSLQFPLTATPTDGDPVQWTALNLPSGASFVSTNESGTFLWPSAGPVGVYPVTFIATDKDGAVTNLSTITVVDVTEDGLETFTNLNAPGTTYAAGSYLGDNGITWTFEGARKPDATYFIDGQSIGFGDSTRNPRTLSSQILPGGISALSLKYARYFTGSGSRSFDVLVNDQIVATVTDANNAAPETLIISGLDIQGNIQIKLVATGSRQIIIDSLSWSGYAPDASDSDNDGIPDDWELENFGSLTNANALTDADADGFLDIEEYIAGTQPNNPASFFAIDAITLEQWSLPAVSGRIYTVESATNLIHPVNWTPGSILTNQLSGALELPLNTEDPIRAYRISVERPPSP
ncbi:MAG TPA: S8 family serine peptidase [Kiritimatiellia bacterium]|nr:S8 family serine peptidase [Kiritimatiellia bacterium]